MERVSPRTGLNGSALAHLLAGWGVLEAPAAPPAFIDGLGHWLDWTHAIPLHAALVTEANAASRPAAPARRPSPDAAAEVAQLRDALVRAITDDAGAPGAPGASGPADARRREPPGLRDAPAATAADALASLDFSTHRRRYADLQRAMDVGLDALRERLRERLATASDDGARLAALDAVMARALGPRERTLTGLLPTLLERHFDRQRDRHAPPPVPAPGAAPDLDPPAAAPAAPPPGAWLAEFRLDMQRLLLAELELRLLPLQGLAEALRPSLSPAP